MVEYIEREAALDIFGDVPGWRGYFEPYSFEVHQCLTEIVKLVKYEINKIQWDIDPEDADSVKLPNEIQIPSGIENEEDISDYISDVTGFCHKGFEVSCG